MKKIISLKKRKKFLKRIKILMLMIVIGVFVFSIKMVNAGINDSKMEKNRIEGIYPVTKLNGVDRIFHLNMYTMNGITSYCIEIGVDMDTDIYNSTYDFSISKLPNHKINYIKNLSFFGYGYTGHNDYRYYMATQELIWEYLSGVNVEWTTELKVDGDRFDIEKYKSDILKLVADYNEGLDLRGYEEYKNPVIGDTLMITDINNNLKYYDIIASEHMNARINGKYIYVDIGTDYIGEDKITLKRKTPYNHSSLLYYQGSSQKLISNGNIDDKVELTFDILGMGITFLIVDNSGIKSNNQYGFKGINYEFFNEDGELVDTLSGSKYGKMSSGELPYGDYCIKQVSSNDAYKLNTDKYCFSFNENTEVVYLEVEPILNDLEILKLYGDNDDLKPEDGALFEIYNIDGSLYSNFETDVDGVGRVKLPYGEYLVKQRIGKSGYYMVDEIKVDAKKKEEVIKYTLVNEMIKTNLVINSKDVDNNYIKDKNIYYKVKDVSSNEYLEINGVNEFQNLDGQTLFLNKFGYGEYILEVVNKSDDYKEIVNELKVVINDNSLFDVINGELYLEVDVNYELVMGSANISSYIEEFIVNDGSYYYDYIENGNVKLDLVADEDIIVNEEVMYSKGEKVLNLVTDENGKYFVDYIYIGKYCLFDESGNSKCFEIKDREAVIVEFKKNIEKGSVKIHNVSNKFNDISDSVIEIYNKDNNLIFTGITNDEGVIQIDDLVYGEYCFRQIKVNNKYEINYDDICFEISNNDLLELEITNKLLRKKLIEIPDTFNNGEDIRKIIIFVLVGVGGIFYKVKRATDNK